jgi:hypothetical protein
MPDPQMYPIVLFIAVASLHPAKLLCMLSVADPSALSGSLLKNSDYRLFRKITGGPGASLVLVSLEKRNRDSQRTGTPRTRIRACAGAPSHRSKSISEVVPDQGMSSNRCL